MLIKEEKDDGLLFFILYLMKKLSLEIIFFFIGLCDKI